ncbi:MAG: hypothetical protein M1415_11655 [Firmicutes bacterium]|nr:hypothetical protein [Bacillota bacterium]
MTRRALVASVTALTVAGLVGFTMTAPTKTPANPEIPISLAFSAGRFLKQQAVPAKWPETVNFFNNREMESIFPDSASAATPVASEPITPTRVSTSDGSSMPLAFDNPAVPPSLALFHGIPEVLTGRGRHVVLDQRMHQRWHAHVMVTESPSTTIGALALDCQMQTCLAAVATEAKSASNIMVFRQRVSDGPWHRVAEIPISPYLVEGDTVFTMAVADSTAWLLAAGSPGAGLMPKALWASPNLGARWTLVAAGDLPGKTRALPMPQGYPSGIVATGPNQVVLSTSPRGDSQVVALVYTLHPRGQQVLGFPVPGQLYMDGAYPALKHFRTLTIPIWASAPHEPSDVLFWATRSRPNRAWQIQAAGAASGDSGITGHDTLVVVNRADLEIHSPGRPTIRAPFKSDFSQPLVATVIARDRILVLGQTGNLWVNTRHGGWQQYAPEPG